MARRPSSGSEPDRCNAGIVGHRTTTVSFISAKELTLLRSCALHGAIRTGSPRVLGCTIPIVTITYPDGTVLEAIVLAHEENEIRAIATGCNDALAFTRIHGTWISEEIEPVTIEFAWQRRGASPTPDLAACICPKTLAARLIQSLFRGCEPVMAEPETLCVFSPEGKRVPISISELPQEVGRGSRCH